MGKMYLLNDNVLDTMKSNISIEKYQGEPFLENENFGRQYRSSIDTFIDLESLPDLYYKDKSEEPLWLQDFNNSKALYSVINSETVPIRYLVDERFWTYLTHTKYWEYLKKRWPADSVDRVKQKWFFDGISQVFSRHSLVRLWWLAECSAKCPRYDDPFELTKTAFEFQDPFNQVIERKISKSRKIFRAALIALHDNQNSQKLKGDRNRTKFGKAINTIAGVKLIEVMPEDDIIKMFNEQIDYIVNEKM